MKLLFSYRLQVSLEAKNKWRNVTLFIATSIIEIEKNRSPLLLMHQGILDEFCRLLVFIDFSTHSCFVVLFVSMNVAKHVVATIVRR